MGGQKHVASGVEVHAVFERLFDVREYQPDGIDDQRSRIRAAGTQSLPLEQPLFATYHALGKCQNYTGVFSSHTGVYFVGEGRQIVSELTHKSLGAKIRKS